MRYLSVCSGIEAATVAWHSHGFQPLAFSEIEKFPRQVLAHHYPDVPLHGDFTVLREQDWIGDADVLVGGTPCQAFSVAGLRNSLDDDRGNLTLEFVRLADAIDDLRPTGCGTIIVWENVPGVLSVKDNAFGCFLGALVGNDDPIVPTGGKWTSAGMVVGPKRSAAWRVLDAQFFGVAQRRRRVFVVASSRDGFDPAEVLFEREGLRRNTPPSREQGKEVAATVAARFGISRNNHEEVVAATIQSRMGLGGFDLETETAVMQCFDRQRSDEYGTDDVASTMKWGSNQWVNQGFAVVQPITQFGEIAGTLSARYDSSPCADRGQNMVVQPTMIHGTQDPIVSDVAFPQGRNSGQENVLVQPMAVTYSIMPMNWGKDYKAREVDVAQPVLAGGPSGGNQGGDYVMQTIAPTLTAANDPSRSPQSTEVTNQVAAVHAASMAVRRLTPRECERLQGFPDDYTAIPKAADGPRYKALGNSMAVPVMAWIGKRIAREIGQ